MFFKKISLIIILNLFLINSSFLFISNTRAAESGGLGISPLVKKGESDRSWFIYDKVKPNSVIEDFVVVSNKTSKIEKVIIYGVDAKTTSDGGYAPLSDEAPRLGVGKWISLSEGELTLKPNEQKIIPFKLNIPQKTAGGDYAGTILIKTAPKEEKSKEGSVMNVVFRVGARIYLNIDGPIIKKLEVKDISYKLENEKPFFYITLKNDGNIRLTPQVSIKITNTKGDVVDTFSAPLREIFGDSEIKVPVEWKSPKSGSFEADFSIALPDDTLFNKKLSFKYIDKSVANSYSLIDLNSTTLLYIVIIGILILAILNTVLKFFKK